MATLYWVGGTGNWSNYTNHWSTSSGGAPNASAVPQTTDDVVFDTSSSTANAAYTVTVDTTSNCRDFTMDGPDPADGTKVTWAGSSTLNIYGNFSLTGGTAGITKTFSGSIVFSSVSTGKTITTNSVSLSTSAINFNGVGGGWTLQDNLTVANGVISLIAGSLDTNSKNVSTDSNFTSSGSLTRSITLGTSTWTSTSGGTFWDVSGTNLSISAASSTIQSTGDGWTFIGGGFTYGTVSKPSGNLTADISINGSNTYTNFTVIGSAHKTGGVIFRANQTITGTFTLTANSVSNRLLVSTETIGTSWTITSASNSFTSVDFKDITGTGAGSWNLSAITGGSGDCGGNSGITFSTPKTWYFHEAEAGGNNTSTIGKWFDATNGGGSVATYPPLPQDTQLFDANSFDAGSKTVTQDMPRIGSVDWTGATNTPTWTTNTTCSVFGSITLISGMTLSASSSIYTFKGIGSNTIDSAGKTWDKPIIINCGNGIGTITLKSAITTGATRSITVTTGTFTAIDGGNNYTITTGTLASTSTGTLSLGSATHIITNTGGTGVNIVSGSTLNAGTSTIKLTGALTSDVTVNCGGKTLYNLWNATTGAFSVKLNTNGTFNDIKNDAGRTMKFTNSTSYTVTTFTSSGSAGNLVTLTNTSSTTRATLNFTGTSLRSDYLNISNLAFTGTDKWFTYYSTDSGNNTGIAFIGSPSRNKAF